jgi:hypothetical protein
MTGIRSVPNEMTGLSGLIWPDRPLEYRTRFFTAVGVV